MKNMALSRLESALTGTLNLKPFRIRTYKKRGVPPYLFTGYPQGQVCSRRSNLMSLLGDVERRH